MSNDGIEETRGATKSPRISRRVFIGGTAAMGVDAALPNSGAAQSNTESIPKRSEVKVGIFTYLVGGENIDSNEKRKLIRDLRTERLFVEVKDKIKILAGSDPPAVKEKKSTITI